MELEKRGEKGRRLGMVSKLSKKKKDYREASHSASRIGNQGTRALISALDLALYTISYINSCFNIVTEIIYSKIFNAMHTILL